MLRGKTILITGSSRGIGAATATLAKSCGANVILHGRTESSELKRLAKKLKSPYFFCDVGDAAAVKKALKKFKKIDVLVNNAGINPSKTFMQLTPEDWRDIFTTNVLGVVNVTKAVLSGMLAQESGAIVNIVSIKGLLHTSAKPAYAASKAAVMRLTSSMAEEFAPHIRVNAVAPGFTDTEMTKGSLSPKIKAQIGKIPLKRMATPKEIAEAVLFLASNKAGYVTGQTVIVDGGYSISG